MERYDYQKLYWDLLESWCDLKIKHGCAVENVEALRKENEELKAKLEKAKDCIEFYAFCQGQDGNIGYRARKTLEEI